MLSTFIHFHPILSTFIRIHNFLSLSVHFHLLSSTLVNFVLPLFTFVVQVTNTATAWIKCQKSSMLKFYRSLVLSPSLPCSTCQTTGDHRWSGVKVKAITGSPQTTLIIKKSKVERIHKVEELNARHWEGLFWAVWYFWKPFLSVGYPD